jgi:hypothetical protein
MRHILAIGFILHGIAHLVGFAVPWGLVKTAPYKTTILAGKIDVHDAGIRIIGLLWLLAALVFAAAGIALLTRQGWWRPATLVAASYSFVLCIVNWPDSRIGAVINVAIVVFLALQARAGWLTG